MFIETVVKKNRIGFLDRITDKNKEVPPKSINSVVKSELI